MALSDLIKQQFIDVIQWTKGGVGDGTLAWRLPMAVFVSEGKVADVVGPGRYTLCTQTLPVLTYRQHWVKLFESPFKSDV